jgi:hypothetical protein
LYLTTTRTTRDLRDHDIRSSVAVYIGNGEPSETEAGGEILRVLKRPGAKGVNYAIVLPTLHIARQDYTNGFLH